MNWYTVTTSIKQSLDNEMNIIYDRVRRRGWDPSVRDEEEKAYIRCYRALVDAWIAHRPNGPGPRECVPSAVARAAAYFFWKELV